MKRSIIIAVFSLCCGIFLSGQEAPGSSDHPLFPRLKGFKLLEYDVNETTSYRFYDEGGTEFVVSGKLTYYYYESDTDMAPAKILAGVSAGAKEKGARMCSHDGNKLCMIIQQDNVEVWADLAAGDFYYTLRIIERAEIDQEVTPESILSDFTEKGETVLYIRYSYRGSTIQPYSLPSVEALAKVLISDASIRVELEGHTDVEGTDLENRKLSLDRASALAAELIKAGIDGARITCAGLGESAPAEDAESPMGKALSRRIVVKRR
jgi:OmpA-OmpF porin, OOP family